MPCYGPITAFYSKEIGSSGKRGIVFKHELSFSGVSFKLPCGNCIGCRLARASAWATRCMHEKRMHDFSSFVTLTYADDKLPHGGTLVRRDVQLFLKRLRKKHGSFRYYGCGEYGDRTGRPHYHLLLFGIRFNDLKLLKQNKYGDNLYDSKDCAGLWKLGHVWIGEVTAESCNYVARYIMKKVNGKQRDAGHYDVVDGHGEIYEREPEFPMMSLKPGIGSSYYDKFGGEVRSHDNVIINAREVPPPRFYDTRSDLLMPSDAGRMHNPQSFAAIKRKRRLKAFARREDNSSRRRRVKEVIALARLKRLERVV